MASTHDAMVIEASAIKLLKRAIDMEDHGRYQPALLCYQEGIDMLMDVLKGCHDQVKKLHYREKLEEYMTRAEKIKAVVEQLKASGKYHEQTKIEENSTGHDYATVFGPYLGDDVSEVRIDDAYVRTVHQINNFVRFCELLVVRCKNLKSVILTTSRDDNQKQQKENLQCLSTSLLSHGVALTINYSDSLHDREIQLSTGWIIKVGRGLDYFKRSAKFAIGFNEMSLRKCNETIVDIFHSRYIKDR